MLLFLIVGFLLVMSLIAFSQRYFTSQVTNQTARTVWASLCTSLAESAVEEAMSEVMLQANDPSSDLFDLLREPVFAPHVGETDLSGHVTLTQTGRLLEEPQFKGFDVDRLEVRIRFQRQFQNLPYERFGLIVYRARAGYNHSFTESIARVVEVGQGFRITLATAPRPFDQPTFMTYVDRPGSELAFEEIGEAYRRHLTRVRDVLSLAAFHGGNAQTPLNAVPLYEEVEKILRPPPYWNSFVREFPLEPVVMFAVKEPGEVVDLKGLELLDRIREKERTLLEPARDRLKEGLSVVAGAQDDPGAHEQLALATQETGRALDAIMEEYKTFSEGWRFWLGDKRSALDKFLYKLERQHWYTKAHAVLRKPKADSPRPLERLPIEDQLKHLLKNTHPFNGIIFLDLRDSPGNPTSSGQVKLDGTDPAFARLEGKIVLVVDGAVLLRDLGKEARPTDLLTVIGLQDEVTVEGEVRGALVTGNDARLVLKPDSKVHGLVLARRIPAPGEREGQVVRDPRFYSGFTTTTDDSKESRDYYVFVTNPAWVYRRVTR